MLTVSGTGVVPGSTVYWGNGPLTTQFVNTTQLTATVPASNLATSGIAAVTAQTIHRVGESQMPFNSRSTPQG